MISRRKVESILLKKSLTLSSNQNSKTMLFITISMSFQGISILWRTKTETYRRRFKNRKCRTKRKTNC